MSNDETSKSSDDSNGDNMCSACPELKAAYQKCFQKWYQVRMRSIEGHLFVLKMEMDMVWDMANGCGDGADRIGREIDRDGHGDGGSHY